MRCLIVSLEAFQKGEVPPEVQQYILSCKKEPFIVLDESSKIKTNAPCKDTKKSKRTQAILKLNKIGHRCILTGTFMSKTPLNAYDQMNFLKDKFFPESMYAFAYEYMIQRELKSARGVKILIEEKIYNSIHKRLNQKVGDPFVYQGICSGINRQFGVTYEDMKWIKEHPVYSPFKNLDQLWQRIGDNCLKIDRKDVLDLPPVMYQRYAVKLTSEQKKLYKALETLHCTDNVSVDNGLKLYLRFQDICNGYEPVDREDNHVDLVPLLENPKLEVLLTVVESIDEQVVVWCSRTKLLYDAKVCLEKAGFTTGVYDGVNKDRNGDYKAFASKEIKVLLCNQASAGYGLDGLKDCNYAIYLCNSYSVEHRVQSEYRTDRGSYTSPKTMIDIVCEGTCEDKVTEALKQGKELISTGSTDTSIFKLEETEDGC